MNADGAPMGHLTWQIGLATAAVADAASDVSALECDVTLLEAVLADQYREARVPPLRPDLFTLVTMGMDEPHWLRFAVIVGMLGREELNTVIPAVSQRMPVRDQIEKGMVVPAKALQAVDLRLLCSSQVRAEELARRVARGLGVDFEGETTAESVARLAKIDYSRLIANVEAARAAAEERRDEMQKAMRPRGKF
jgi:hypothetical protein